MHADAVHRERSLAELVNILLSAVINQRSSLPEQSINRQ